MPKEYQEIFKTAAYEANINMLAAYDALNRDVISQLVAGGTQLTRYSDDILQAAQKISFEIYEENAAKEASFKEIYEPWKAFREKVYKWNKVNELSFANFVMSKA